MIARHADPGALINDRSMLHAHMADATSSRALCNMMMMMITPPTITVEHPTIARRAVRVVCTLLMLMLTYACHQNMQARGWPPPQTTYPAEQNAHTHTLAGAFYYRWKCRYMHILQPKQRPCHRQTQLPCDMSNHHNNPSLGWLQWWLWQVQA
jgi:hypothetical protein